MDWKKYVHVGDTSRTVYARGPLEEEELNHFDSIDGLEGDGYVKFQIGSMMVCDPRTGTFEELSAELFSSLYVGEEYLEPVFAKATAAIDAMPTYEEWRDAFEGRFLAAKKYELRGPDKADLGQAAEET